MIVYALLVLCEILSIQYIKYMCHKSVWLDAVPVNGGT